MLIALNGRIEKAKWEYLGFNSLLIERENSSFLFKHGFFDENILALKLDSKEEYAFLVNESKYNAEINTIDSVKNFLTDKYFNNKLRNEIFKEKSEFQSKLTIPKNFNFKVVREAETGGIFTKKYVEFEIVFESNYSLYGEMYLEKKTKKYFHRTMAETLYFEGFEECLHSLGKYLIEQKNKN